MNTTFLVQRLLKPGKYERHPFGGGLKFGGFPDGDMKLFENIFMFDYMAASEFEFGDVPKSFTQICNSNIIKGEIKVRGVPIYYICLECDSDDIVDRIKSFSNKDGSHLKCPTHFSISLKTIKSKGEPKIVGWLDIENNFMFFVDKEMFEKCFVLFTEL